VAALVTPDVAYDNGRLSLHGRAELAAWLAGRATAVRTTRHMWSALRVNDVAPGRVEATSVWVCYAANAPAPHPEVQVSLVADFVDEFIRDDGAGWLLASRRISGVFRNPDVAPVAG
jgi:hypothetical protein